MRLAFFGTGSFAVPALRALARSVVLVVTQPDRPSGRGMRLQPTEIKAAALELDRPVVTPDRVRDPAFLESLQELNLDALIVADYGKILPQAVLDSAKRGGINLHGSILPKYRGAAPIQRAILNGERETGVTLMQMERGMDTGAIFDVRKTPIQPEDTAGELRARLADLAGQMIADRIEDLIATGGSPHPQDESKATLAPKFERADAELRVTGEADREYNRFRASTPNPGAWIATRFGPLKVHQAKRSDLQGEPGTILAASPLCVIGFAHGSIALIEVGPQGKPRISGKDFLNGHRLRPGDRITEPSIA